MSEKQNIGGFSNSVKLSPTVRQTFAMPDGVVEQQFDDYGNHRLVMGDEASLWAGYAYFTELNDYRGCSEYYGDLFPRVFKIIKPLE